MLKPRALDHLVLVVDDIDVSTRFWRDVIGAEFEHQSGDYSQFRIGEVRLGLFQVDAMAATLGREISHPAPGAAGFELGFEVDDVDATYDELVAAGATPITPPDDRPWGQRTAYVADPDGYLIELVRPL